MNIYWIWVPSERKVYHTRDVIFNKMIFYDKNNLDLAKILKVKADQIIECIDLPWLPNRLTRREIEDLTADNDLNNPILGQPD